MKIGEPLLKILNKAYQPLSTVEMVFKRYDLKFITNDQGKPVLLFIGKKTSAGTIRGERFARTLQVAADGKVLKDHWDNKGQTG